MLLTLLVFSQELQCTLEKVDYRACITFPSIACTRVLSFQPRYVILSSVGWNACLYIHLNLNGCVIVIYLSAPTGFLHAGIQGLEQHVAENWSSAVFSCCQQTASSGLKAGKEEYLQRVPRPSAMECRRENRSLFISRPWTSLLRGQGVDGKKIFL